MPTTKSHTAFTVKKLVISNDYLHTAGKITVLPVVLQRREIRGKKYRLWTV